MASRRWSPGLFRARLRALRAMVESSRFLADYGFARRRRDLWLEGVEGLLAAANFAAGLLSFRARTNPPSVPQTPGEWTSAVTESVNAYMALARQIRRGKGRISARTLRAWTASLLRLETRLVLQARAMHEEFLLRWPKLWTEAVDRKFRRWYGMRLR